MKKIIILLCLLLLITLPIDGKRLLVDDGKQQSFIERFINFFRSILSFLLGGNGIKCGTNTCFNNEYCCNESCNICAKQGNGCIKKLCLPPLSTPVTKPAFVSNAPSPIIIVNGTTITCGTSFCGKGEYCCNESCSICVQEGVSCDSEVCCLDDNECSPYICRACTPNVQPRICDDGVCVLP